MASALWDRTRSFLDIEHFPMSLGVSEQGSERMSAAECASKVSSVEQANEWALHTDERLAQHLRPKSWLFGTTVERARSEGTEEWVEKRHGGWNNHWICSTQARSQKIKEKMMQIPFLDVFPHFCERVRPSVHSPISLSFCHKRVEISKNAISELMIREHQDPKNMSYEGQFKKNCTWSGKPCQNASYA